MKVLFVRHAEAVDLAKVHGGNDTLRQLTADGRKTARAAFKGYARVVEQPAVVLSSEALRARETAEILARAFGGIPVRTSKLLNPGCTHAKLLKLLRSVGSREYSGIAVVGHEPDFSGLISAYTSAGRLRVDVKKASLVQVDLDESLEKGTLELIVTPRVVKRLAGASGRG
jgi:phosphohistidine phosphatase